eukprot:4589292-Amphidinium_carterae.1
MILQPLGRDCKRNTKSWSIAIACSSRREALEAMPWVHLPRDSSHSLQWDTHRTDTNTIMFIIQSS